MDRRVQFIDDFPDPKLGSGDIIVEMKVCGLCGTDIEKIHGEYAASKPVIGHEASGIISEIGENIENLKIGDRVFPHHHTPCYDCHFCNMGSETMCKEYKSSNIDPGGFSEFFRVPSWNITKGGILKIPQSVSYEAASFIEPVACCIRGLNRCGISRDSQVLVVGAGPIGLTHVQLLSEMGIDPIVSDISKMRLAFAENQGVSRKYDVTTIDIPRKVRDDTKGLGVDVAIVASRKGGKICLFGVPIIGSVLDYDFSSIFNSEVSIISSYGATEIETRKALKLIEEKKVDPSSLISHRFSLDQFNDALETAIQGNCMKIVITP
jgi:L-iditol 2-dehydrogenase